MRNGAGLGYEEIQTLRGGGVRIGGKCFTVSVTDGNRAVFFFLSGVGEDA